MAVDEALLRAMNEDDAPILRFYRWNPSCLSIGRFQEIEKLSLDDVPYVRRPTGGRAVWHDLEVTYSVILREEHLPPGARSIVDSYRFISEGFLRGLRHLGVEASIAATSAVATSAVATSAVATSTVATSTVATSSTRSSVRLQRTAGHRESAPNCFESQTRADFVVDGRKILGAAQCRQGGAILQHGSLLLDINRAEWREKVGGDLNRIVTLRALGISAPREDVQFALARGVAETFDALLENDHLNARETQMANALLHKYDSPLWNASARCNL